MTPQLQQAIDLARTLSFIEQLELLKAISSIMQQANAIETQNREFWQDRSISNLLEEQQPPIVTDLSLLGVEGWENDDPTDEFLSFLSQQRQPEPIEN